MRVRAESRPGLQPGSRLPDTRRVKCWGVTRQKRSCRNTATTWCLLGNVRYALCDLHASVNKGARMQRIRVSRGLRRSGT